MRAKEGIRALACVIIAIAAMRAEAATPSLATGNERTCAVNRGGGALCWGFDNGGALGVGSFVLYRNPIPVVGLSSNVARIITSPRAYHVCAVTTSGQALCWGNNEGGQLGNGTLAPSTVAAPVSGLSSGVSDMAVGGFHTCALTTAGAVLCWGDDLHGQLGDGQTNSAGYLVPVAVTALSTGVRALTAGTEHTCALLTSGAVKCWGSNQYGQLGNGSFVDSGTPVSVSGLGANVVAIAAGFFHTCALTSAGNVLCWGENTDQQLGDGTSTTRTTPVSVGALSGVTEIAAGGFHNCAIVAGGAVSCWGYNFYGEIGDGTYTDRGTPVAVTGAGTGVTGLSLGYAHSCALKAGALQCWGYNGYGELGSTSTSDSNVPVAAARVTSTLAALAVGNIHSCALTSTRTAVCWGANVNFQLGNGQPVGFSTPSGVSGLGSGVTAIATGDAHACALTQAGGAQCWGNGNLGQLGVGFWPYASSLPSAVSLTTTLTSIATGQDHTCAITSAGGALCWGENEDGQLGDGTLTTRGAPTQVVGLSSGLTAISAGSSHTCALGATGSVQCWGLNSSGQLGTGSTTSVPTPVTVGGLPPARLLSVGGFHTCVVTTAGAALCWGYNGNGRLGDGTSTDRFTPTQVSGLSSGVAAIAAGRFHTCALTTAGSVLCWGYNRYGQLGNGKTIDSYSPVAVSGLPSGIVAITAGWYHTCALTSSGETLCWGSNSTGGLGDGTFARRSKPVVVASEGGAGSLAGNNWYLDLDPGAQLNISSDLLPTFVATTTGNAATAIVDVTASIQFRAQDVGQPIYVFGYVPASLVPGAVAAKDGDGCVLAQIGSSGQAQQASASGLQGYTNNVTSTQGQAVNVMNSVLAANVSGGTFCVGAGATGTQAVDPTNSRCFATVPPASSTATICDVPAAGSGTGGSNAVANAGFESGAGSWTQTSSLTGSNIITNDSAAAHSGSWYAWLGGYDNGTDTLYQPVTVPTGAGSASLQFWYRITTAETSTTTAYDRMTVTIANASTGATLATLATFSNLNAAAGWVQSPPYDVSAFKGQTVRVVFTAVLDASNTTSFRIDDVTLSTSSTASASYEGLWLKGDESGWGVNVTHQGTTLFATWFTYDTDGTGMWLVMSNGTLTSPGNFSGTLYRTVGPAFSAVPFNSISFPANYTAVGTLSFSFTDANTGTMTYTVNGVTQAKSITRFIFGASGTNCTLGGSQGSSPNYQDLWLRSATGSQEAGWGINITHQGDILFATWFTYLPGSGQANKGMWLVMSNGAKVSNGVYSGPLQTTTGPAFNTVPFNPNSVNRSTVGTGTFTFTDANNGTFNYTVNGVTQSKPIARYIYASPSTVCQ
jgi:alpha-tubulin suppressor-like RCC1 family protein